MSVKSNITANVSANIWSAVISLIFVPVYIRYIGIEGYGLIGIYGTLQSMASLLDLGLATTMNREMARLSARGASPQEARSLVRTFETIYWVAALAIGLVVAGGSSLIAHHWITAVHLSSSTVRQALVLIGVVMLFQWPFGLYTSGLMGLQRQVLLAIFTSGTMTLRGIGAVLILQHVSHSVQAFFAWQVFISLASTLLVRWFLWRNLPACPEAAAFDWKHLRRVWRFAASMSAMGVLSLLLLQTDKVILSRLLTLETFGYYTLAWTVTMALYMLIYPIYNAVFPRLTLYVAENDQAALIRLYHQGSQIMSVALIPAAMVLAIFSKEIIFVWTGNPTIAANTHWLVTLLAIGTAAHGLAHVPWALQLAYAWPRLGLVMNAVEVAVLVPLVIVLAIRFGAIGGAVVWALLNIAYIAISQPLVHHRFLRGELWRWVRQDVGLPVLAAGGFVGVARLAIRLDPPRPVMGVLLFGISGCALAAAASVVPATREWAAAELRKSWLFAARLGRG